MPSQDELRALWASGIPLDDAWLEFTPDTFDAFMLRLLRTAPANDGMYERAADESVWKRYAELKGWLPMTWEGRQAKLTNKIRAQRSYLLDNLYRGELWAIGFRTLANGFDELARVPRHCFFTDYEDERDVRPNVYWAKGELTAEADSYFDIRVLRAPVTTTTEDQPKPSDQKRHAAENKYSEVGASGDDVTTQPTAETLADDDRPELPVRGKPGRPSEGEVILAAIAAYRATDPKLKKPRRERYAAYKSYISSQGYDPRRDQGFSEKTLQKYETKFRKQTQ